MNPYPVTADLSGKYVYVVNEGGNSISQYNIEGDGNLIPMSTHF